MSKTYKVKMHCSNCDYGKPNPIEHDIEMGLEIYRYSMYNACPKCGCNDLRKAG